MHQPSPHVVFFPSLKHTCSQDLHGKRRAQNYIHLLFFLMILVLNKKLYSSISAHESRKTQRYRNDSFPLISFPVPIGLQSSLSTG